MSIRTAQDLRDAYQKFNEKVLSNPSATLADMRADAEVFGEMTTEPADVACESVSANGVPALMLTPAGCATDRVLQYTHGGGYVFCSANSHRRMAGHIAKATGCRALVVDYRLAPEHPHPAPVMDALAAYRWLLDQGITPGHIALSGDSAGGGLVIGTLLKVRDEGLPQPAGAVPISPWTDMEATGATMKTRAAVDKCVSEAGIRQLAPLFLGGNSSKDPYASPHYADLKGIAPLYIQVGDEETLLDDSIRLAHRAVDAGVEVKLEIYPEMQHIFQICAGYLPQADLAISRMAAWLKPRLGL
jgi:acetyl esterase/lipase